MERSASTGVLGLSSPPKIKALFCKTPKQCEDRTSDAGRVGKGTYLAKSEAGMMPMLVKEGDAEVRLLTT